MAEYIEREALYRKICELEELARNRYLDTPSNSPAYPRYMAQMNERTALKHLVFDMPAADVVPVRHGYWDENGRCTACGGHAPFWCMASTYYKSPFCHECGAKMDEVVSE